MGTDNYVSYYEKGFSLADQCHVPVIYIDEMEYEGVIRAAKDLTQDIKDVTGVKGKLQNQEGGATVFIGTIGKSRGIDRLIAEGILDVSGIKGKWECFRIQMWNQILVIAGSDKRGTIYGIYDLCEKIGVSPWKWWADVKPCRRNGLYIDLDEAYEEGEPSVKYRGIFINDEYAFDNWAYARGDLELVETYQRIYELLLRLKANMLWPAMHSSSPHFHKNPVNALNAQRYGIIIGSTHCEMLLRNNLSEYFDFEKTWEEEHQESPLFKMKLSDSPTPCAYVYTDVHPETGEKVCNKELLEAYWRESIEKYGRYECVFTIGMRGLHDASWQPVGAETLEEKAVILEEVIKLQRRILSETLGQRPEEIPQLFIPYKEMQEIYDTGVDLPEDVTLMWTDDNYGYIRQLPTEDSGDRTGGAGIYYHVSYHGDPNSYIWLCSTPLALIREEMTKAYDCQARTMWMLNVGDLKPAEGRIEYFLSLARDMDAIKTMDLKDYLTGKAVRDFGFSLKAAEEYAEIELKFEQLVYARKPEHFRQGLFNCRAYGDEGQTYVEEYRSLLKRSQSLYEQMEEKRRPAFYQLLFYPLKACCYTAEKFIYADKSLLYEQEGRGSSANGFAALSDKAYFELVQATKEYNGMLEGKWNLIMDPFQPAFCTRRATLPNLLEKGMGRNLGYAELGVSEEMDMTFSRYGKNTRFLDIYNMGSGYIDWQVQPVENWVICSRTEGTVWAGQRIFFTISWKYAPRKCTTTKVRLVWQNSWKERKQKEIQLWIDNRIREIPPKTYVEAHGYVSIEAEHFSSCLEGMSGDDWVIEKYLGRRGDSIRYCSLMGKTIERNKMRMAACVSYQIMFESTGSFVMDIYRIPTLNERGGQQFGVSIDSQEMIILEGNKAYVNNSDGTDSWGRGVLRNSDILTTRIEIKIPGIHTLNIFGVDTGVMIDKMVIYTREKTDSYFGPSESYNTTWNCSQEEIYR